MGIRWSGPVQKGSPLGHGVTYWRKGTYKRNAVEVETHHYSGQTWCLTVRVGERTIRNNDWTTVEGGYRAVLARGATQARDHIDRLIKGA